MRYGTLPDVAGPVSRLVMGSMVFSIENQQRTNDILDRFVEAGGTAVDTARVYSKGTSEAAFGNWLKERGLRDKIVVIGKGAHHDSQTLERRVNAAAIHEDIEISLGIMQLDRMDVYILHKDDEDAPVGPVIDALNEEHRAGRIGAFGGSSWRHQRIAEANAYAEAHGLKPFSVSSPNLALAVPVEPMWAGCVTLAGDRDALDWYEKTRMPIFAWSSQARGFFSGRYQPGMTGETMDQQNVIRTYFSDENWERYRRAESLAGEKGCNLRQIALAWVLHQPLELYALIGPASVEELDDCLGALDVKLSEEELLWLNLQKEPIRALA
ncbi:MAG: aldo/keto reductase [Chloroflexi bacterium]|nr:aldo/keto reductase [Chloroflexota bacterium]